MRALPLGLAEHLATGATTLCWCWRVDRKDGVALGFTDHDRPLSFDGVDYEAIAGFTATEAQSQLGLAADNLDVAGALRSDRITETDLADGRYDGAAVRVWRVNWAGPAQRLLMWRGQLGDVSRGALAFTAEIRSLSARFDETRGRLFQHACDAELGDARCGVDLTRSSYRVTGAVTDVTDAARFAVSVSTGYADNWFRRGRLTFSTGVLAPLSFEVRSQTAFAGTQMIEVWPAASRPPGIGDAFVLTAGCDKAFATCRDKFANTLNFRGFPHMPGDDFVFRYPRRDEAENGGRSLFGS